MNILVACEESQAVTKELRRIGHNAFSCDIQKCSGGHPEWHIKGDCLPLLNGNCDFVTEDGKAGRQAGRWDMLIAFPPCTHLAVSGARHFEKKRADGRQREGVEFFCKFLEADCDRICIENPVNIIGGEYIKKWFPDLVERYGLPRKPAQIIQPWQFGHPYTKSTCLWLKGLPCLKHTEVLTKPNSGWVNQAITSDGRYGGFNRLFSGSIQRSKTFPGIARAIAEQWAGKEERHDERRNQTESD